MSLQPTGSNVPNADALRAIGNMTSAVEASGDRVQRSNDEVISTLRKALEQSDSNNRLLADQNARLSERVTQLEQNRVELEASRQAERQACQEKMEALSQKVDSVIQQLNKTTEKLDALQKHYDGHSHVYNINTTDWHGLRRTHGPSY